MIALCWVFWTARNKLLLFKGKREDPISMGARAESAIESFKTIKQPEIDYAARKKEVRQQQWCPPPDGWLKANVDAAGF